jgi:hypothetical protein
LHTTPIPQYRKLLGSPKLSCYKQVIHRLKLYALIDTSVIMHLEFNPLILSPKTFQGYYDSIRNFVRSSFLQIFYCIVHNVRIVIKLTKSKITIITKQSSNYIAIMAVIYMGVLSTIKFIITNLAPIILIN